MRYEDCVKMRVRPVSVCVVNDGDRDGEVEMVL